MDRSMDRAGRCHGSCWCRLPSGVANGGRNQAWAGGRALPFRLETRRRHALLNSVSTACTHYSLQYEHRFLSTPVVEESSWIEDHACMANGSISDAWDGMDGWMEEEEEEEMIDRSDRSDRCRPAGSRARAARGHVHTGRYVSIRHMVSLHRKRDCAD